jgi:hypothetical protein
MKSINSGCSAGFDSICLRTGIYHNPQKECQGVITPRLMQELVVINNAICPLLPPENNFAISGATQSIVVGGNTTTK